MSTMELPTPFDRPDRSKMYFTPSVVLAYIVDVDRDKFIRAMISDPPYTPKTKWVLMPSGRWTKTVLKAVGEYLVLSAWIGGEWAITHKGERLAAWHDGAKGADLAGAQALAEEAAEKLRE